MFSLGRYKCKLQICILSNKTWWVATPTTSYSGNVVGNARKHSAIMEITYLKGDATQPIGKGNKIIVHVCNDIGAWGKGFVLAISRKWKKPEQAYREWAKNGDNFILGEVQFIEVESDLWIANIIGQRDIRKDKEGNPPVRYGAIRKGLATVGNFARQNNASVHMPRIGCGLAGGEWPQIESSISHELTGLGVATYVYDFV